ncbi:MAG: DNA-binding response regulator [Candidatus Muproteobacteria bacterium RBG_16_62_13]|uniref:DNA-binding response regulator n=1 Tax=Candidatus Muproteobacteria bacterium RBG_16_62_13 TaxID=1817756 RepID=A0A1F6T3L4_9PROT|nr:MAG: DNA-binding response regulator [Candidatus Muproteobacteria bacterium RBG_16_62_13]
MSRILLADDDAELTEMLSEYLAGEGFSVDTVHDGESALARAGRGDIDLLVLDVMMPKKNGFDVLRDLRAHSLLPVLMLTARDEDVDSIIGLELGADDYLPKPCNPRVLVARIRAILRRAGGETSSASDVGTTPALTVGDVELHTGTRRVTRGGEPMVLTSTEYAVVEALLREAGRVVSKADLSERALGRKLMRYDRSLDMHVSALRRKLGPLPGGEERIKTVRGVGYQYVRS